MSHDENSASGNPFEDDDGSIDGLSTSFGDDFDEDGSQAIESAGEEEEEEVSDRDASPPRRAPARRQRGDAPVRRGGGNANRQPRGRGVAATNRARPAARSRTTSRGAGQGRARRPVKGASRFCGRCGSQVRDTDGHSHKGCGRTYFYKFSVSKSTRD